MAAKPTHTTEHLNELREMLGDQVSEEELTFLASVLTDSGFDALLNRGLDDLKAGRVVPRRKRRTDHDRND